MHLAIIDDNDQVFVEYDQEVFLKLLVKYFGVYNSVEKAFSEVVNDLRNLTRNK